MELFYANIPTLFPGFYHSASDYPWTLGLSIAR